MLQVLDSKFSTLALWYTSLVTYARNNAAAGDGDVDDFSSLFAVPMDLALYFLNIFIIHRWNAEG